MKRHYLVWRSNLINCNVKLTRQNVIEGACNCWKNDTIISHELIKVTFKNAGITIDLNCEEYNKVKIFDRMNKIMPNNILDNEKYKDSIIELNKNNILLMNFKMK